MNKKSKLVLVCGLALAMLITTQQTAKADTTTDTQVETVASKQVDQTQAISQATSDTPAQAPTTQTQDAQQNTVTDDATTQTNADTDSNVQAAQSAQTQVATTQADANTGNITPVKGVVTTNNQIAYLYQENGSEIENRALAPNSPWVTDQKLVLNGTTYYRVATNEYTNGNSVVLTYGNDADGEVRVNQNGAANYSRSEQGFYNNGQQGFGGNTTWKYNRTDNVDGLTYYQIANNIWVNSNDATTAPAYQNPSGWLQIQNTQIQPVGDVGYPLYNGMEGIKTWYVRKYFGYSNAHTIYDGNVANSVRGLQARKGLPVTGIVDLATWEAMGFVESSWYSIDSYVAPLRTNITSSRADHVEAMISEAYQYYGQPWISGAASSPATGVDCSGLVTQAMYASGINPAPVSAIQHAQPGNEWNCQMLWNDGRIPNVSFNDRQRGDLIFFTDPSSGMLWHVGILLNPTTMIESWPYAVQEHSIYSGRGNIAGVKRVFA